MGLKSRLPCDWTALAMTIAVEHFMLFVRTRNNARNYSMSLLVSANSAKWMRLCPTTTLRWEPCSRSHCQYLLLLSHHTHVRCRRRIVAVVDTHFHEHTT